MKQCDHLTIDLMKSLSIVIPVYNEEQRIKKCFNALEKFKPPKEVEIDRVIFVSDGSDDLTNSKIKSFILKSKKYNVRLVSYRQNKGRGYALKLGMTEATGDYALWLDADMSTPLSQVNKFLPFMKKNIPVIIGSRKIKGAVTTKRQPLHRILLGQGFSKLSEIMLEVPVGDFTCGFKAFSKYAYSAIFPKCKINGCGNDSETLFLAKKFNLLIAEVPIIWRNDARSKVKILRDIFVSFFDLCKIRYYDVMGLYEIKKLGDFAFESV